MKNTSSSNDTESTVLGWKFVVIVGIITTIFFTFLYLAMSSDPEYMPNREPKVATQPAQPTMQSHAAIPDGDDGKPHKWIEQKPSSEGFCSNVLHFYQ